MAAEKSRKKDKNEDVGFIQGIRIYLSEVRSEIRKVTWPDQDDVRRLTYIVLLVTIISSLVLGALSIFFSAFFNFGINNGVGNIMLVALFVAIFVGAWWFVIRGGNQRTRY